MRFSLLFLLAACGDDICTRQTDCAANQTCSIDGRCVGATSTPDAGDTVDATPDALDGGMP